MIWLKCNWRALLSRLPLPMLALAASWGVYSFAAAYVPQWVAIVQAAAFELTYIGLAVTRDLSGAQRRRATAISIGAVAASVLYNSIDGYFARNPAALAGLPWWAEAIGAVLHGAPLAIVAYLVADLLLHSQPRRTDRAAQLRRLVRALARQLRTARRELAPLGAMLAQVQAEAAQLRADAAQQAAELVDALRTAAQAREELALQRAIALAGAEQVAQLQAELAQQQQDGAQVQADAAQLRAELARTQAERAQLESAGDLDKRAVAQALRDAGLSTRRAAELLRTSESTLRSWTQAPRRVSSAAD